MSGTTKNHLIDGDKSLAGQQLETVVFEDDKGHVTTRMPSVLEREVKVRSNSAHRILDFFPESNPLPHVSAYIPLMLADAIFVGHLVTDLDSIAGAIGAAELYGGIAARASEVNSETKFALDYWGVPAPVPIEQLVVSQPHAGICLVDHQQLSQVNPCISPERVVGVIDHHALQNSTLVTERPIYMDIRPWGSMSTIIAHTFLLIQRRPRKCVAGMLLCAILSDTLNLMSPTTTQYDRMMVAVLCELADVADVNSLAKMQFKAKSKELEWLTSAALCTGDLKVFSYSVDGFKGTMGFAVIETVDDGAILSRHAELVAAMAQAKVSRGLELMFLAVVNIVELHSTMLLVGELEHSLARVAFPHNARQAELFDRERQDMREKQLLAGGAAVLPPYSLGGRVSRKSDFVPAISRCINKGEWAPGPEAVAQALAECAATAAAAPVSPVVLGCSQPTSPVASAAVDLSQVALSAVA